MFTTSTAKLDRSPQVSLGPCQARNCVIVHDKVSTDIKSLETTHSSVRLDLLHNQSESPVLGYILIISSLLCSSESHQIPRIILWDTWQLWSITSLQLSSFLQSLHIPDSQSWTKQGSTTPVLQYTEQSWPYLHNWPWLLCPHSHPSQLMSVKSTCYHITGLPDCDPRSCGLW